jgi:hypothetical protein
MKCLAFMFVCLSVARFCMAQEEDLPTPILPEVEMFQKFYGRYGIDAHPLEIADTDLIGIWKAKEDSDRHNYFVVQRCAPTAFVFTYMNRGGSNRTYENVSLYFSKIDGVDFLNVYYLDTHLADGPRATGWFFLKVIDKDPEKWDMTVALVTDTTLIQLPDSKSIRERIAKNMHNPAYFGKPVHFDKILPLYFCK